MIRNTKYHNQKHSFEQLDVAFSDMDGFRIYHGKYCVLLEGKHHDNSKPKTGQRNLMMTMCRMLKVPSIYIIYEHQESAPEVVNVANAKVVEFFFGEEWKKTKMSMNELINKFIKAHTT